MTSMALDRFDAVSEVSTRRSSGRRRRTRQVYIPTASVPVRAAVIDVREADPTSSKLARMLMRPLVLGVMLTAAWQIGLIVGQLPL